uniref:Fibrinogen C-terminal domain-containing protein n=1 Tax=Stomoxys calcitrans TaxID=35570 RepID=A0A1I8NQ32_STOCA
MKELDELNTIYLIENRLDAKKSKPWTTILRRNNGSVDFSRKWTDYQEGFGDAPNGEFFIGLNKLHTLTANAPHELLVILKDWDNEMRYAHYANFKIGSAGEKYAIKELGEYTGDAGDALEGHKGMRFSTSDQNNDASSSNCALDNNGAWWFKDCFNSHLNGPYKTQEKSHENGVTWDTWKPVYSLKFAAMKIRKISI